MSDIFSSLTALSLPILAQLAGGQGQGQANSPAVWWLIGLAAVAVGFNQIASAWGRLTGRWQERPTGERLVTEEACRRRHENHENHDESVKGAQAARIETLRLEVKEDVKGIHNRIDDIMGAVRDLRGRVETMMTLRKP